MWPRGSSDWSSRPSRWCLPLCSGRRASSDRRIGERPACTRPDGCCTLKRPALVTEGEQCRLRSTAHDHAARWRSSARTQVGRAWYDRYRWIAEDASARWISDSERSLPHAPRQRLGIAIDVTAEQEAEEQLAEQRRRYQTLVEQMPLAVYLRGAEDGDSIYVSPQIEEVLG